MQDYLLDTNIIGYFSELRGDCKSFKCNNLRNNLDKLSENAKLFLSVVSKGEIEYGLKIAPIKDLIQQERVRIIITEFQTLDIDSNVALNYGELRGRLFEYCAPKDKKRRAKKAKRVEEWFDPTTSKELTIQENDLWLCAIAMTYNLIFITEDNMDALKNVAKGDITFENWLD